MIPANERVSREFIVFTSCAMVLTALGIDIMLPAFADVRKSFNLPENSTDTAKLVSFFFMGQITQILFGYLTDRKGRLPVLRFGVIIYIISGTAVVAASSLPWMFFFRFIAGMGAAAVLMTSIATVRDRYVGDAMARVMSFVLSLFLFTPVVAPAIGALLVKSFHWKAVFAVPPAFAIIIFLWSFRMQETHPPEKRSKMGAGEAWGKFRFIITHPVFLRYITIATLLFSVLSSYVSSSEHMIGGLYHRPDIFPYVFGGIGLLMAVFALSNSYWSKKFGAHIALRYSLLVYFVAALLMLTGTWIWRDPPPLSYFFILMALLMALTVIADPNSSALSLELLGDHAGLAASVYGTIFFFIGSAIGTLISSRLTTGLFPLALCATVFSFVAVLLAFGDKRKNKTSSAEKLS